MNRLIPLSTLVLCACGGSTEDSALNPSTELVPVVSKPQVSDPQTSDPAPQVPQPQVEPTPPSFSIMDLGGDPSGIVLGTGVSFTDSQGMLVYRHSDLVSVGSFNDHAAFETGSKITDLGPGLLLGFNNKAEYVGYSVSDRGLNQASLYSSGQFTSLPVTVNSEALGINDSDEIIGQYSVGTDNHGVIWIGGTLFELSTDQVQITNPFGINCQGTIVAFGYPVGESPYILHSYILTRTDVQRDCKP